MRFLGIGLALTVTRSLVILHRIFISHHHDHVQEKSLNKEAKQEEYSHSSIDKFISMFWFHAWTFYVVIMVFKIGRQAEEKTWMDVDK